MNAANKKLKTEQEIVIQTLTDKELKDFDPPIVSAKKPFLYQPAKNADGSTKEMTRRAKNSSCVSMVNEFLGVGGFSKVYKFKKDDKNKAVKKIMSNPKIYSAKLTIVDSVKREVFGMIKCACKHTVKLYEVYQNQAMDNFFLLMELCDGNMEHLIASLGRPLNTMEIKEVLNQLNEVFFKLYISNIIHRDIKPTNILFLDESQNKNEKDKDKDKADKNGKDDIAGKADKNDNDGKTDIDNKTDKDDKTDKEDKTDNDNSKNLPFNGKKLTFKLTDYGVCLPLYSNQFSCGQFMGTLDFMAPEIYEKKTSVEQPMYTTKIDLFSLGQTILNLMGFIKKARPLDIKGIKELRKNNTLFNGSYQDQLLADLIFNNLLVADPDDRVNWELYFLHPFFENNEEEDTQDKSESDSNIQTNNNTNNKDEENHVKIN